MPTRDEHLAQWRHNRRFLASADPEFPDWQATATFYAALHAVAALLAHDGLAPPDHASRNRALRTVRRYAEVERHYSALYIKSQAVRYHAAPSDWPTPPEVQRDLVERHLYPLERSVQKLTGVDLQLAPVTLRTA